VSDVILNPTQGQWIPAMLATKSQQTKSSPSVKLALLLQTKTPTTQSKTLFPTSLRFPGRQALSRKRSQNWRRYAQRCHNRTLAHLVVADTRACPSKHSDPKSKDYLNGAVYVVFPSSLLSLEPPLFIISVSTNTLLCFAKFKSMLFPLLYLSTLGTLLVPSYISVT
jgi:hypothetical protein